MENDEETATILDEELAIHGFSQVKRFKFSSLAVQQAISNKAVIPDSSFLEFEQFIYQSLTNTCVKQLVDFTESLSQLLYSIIMYIANKEDYKTPDEIDESLHKCSVVLNNILPDPIINGARDILVNIDKAAVLKSCSGSIGKHLNVSEYNSLVGEVLEKATTPIKSELENLFNRQFTAISEEFKKQTPFWIPHISNFKISELEKSILRKLTKPTSFVFSDLSFKDKVENVVTHAANYIPKLNIPEHHSSITVTEQRIRKILKKIKQEYPEHLGRLIFKSIRKQFCGHFESLMSSVSAFLITGAMADLSHINTELILEFIRLYVNINVLKSNILYGSQQEIISNQLSGESSEIRFNNEDCTVKLASGMNEACSLL